MTFPEIWATVLDRAEALADRSPRPDAADSLMGLTSRLRECPPEALHAQAVTASELSGLIEQAHALIDLDARGRDPFWALRNVLADIALGMSDVLELIHDPWLGSEVVRERLLATLATEDPEGMQDILPDGDQARRRLVAALIYRLVRSRDHAGALAWFRTPRPQLRNRTPVEILDDHEAQAGKLLLPLAGGSAREVA